MKSLPQWSATFLLAAPVGAWALGLGDIELHSALNQPLRAEIELLSVTPEDLNGLRVALANRATFERYELDLSTELSGLAFDVGRNGAGAYVITVTSRQPMANPFLTFLVEATWPRGRLLREYTVLLDPPIFTPEIGAEPQIRQAAAGAASGASAAFARAPQEAAVITPSTRAAADAPTAAPAAAGAQNALASGAYGPVQSSESLWSIASSLRPDGVSVNQMMVALYEANPSAFDGNMNLLLRGATLTIPDRSALTARTAAEATAIVGRAANARREAAASTDAALASAGAAPASPADEPRLRLVPPSVESVAAAPAGASSAGAPVSGAQGSSGAAGADAAATAEVARLEGEVAALRAELDESRRLLQLRDQSLEALQARLAAADALPAAAAAAGTTPGVDLEAPADERLFADELASEELGVEREASSVEAATASVDAAAAAAAARSPAAPAPAVEPSLLQRVLGMLWSPLLLIGLGFGAVLLTAAWYMRSRRQDAEELTGRWDALQAEEDTVVSAPGEPPRSARPAAESDALVVDELAMTTEAAAAALAAAQPRSAAEEIEDTLSNHTVINLDQGDVLAEADFHMAYGLYDQAAELVQKAIDNEPARRDLKLKLLEVFFVWGNKDAFRTAARELHAEIGSGDGDWDKALIMGKQLCPDDALFAESTTGAAGEVDLDLADSASTALDFSFDEPTQMADLDGLDFDLAATGERLGPSADDLADFDIDYDDGRSEDAGEDSLDIGAQTAAGLEEALFSADDDEETGRAIADLLGEDVTARAEFAFSDDDDTGAREEPRVELDGFGSSDIELESLAVTQESPTVESDAQPFGGDWRSALGIDDAGSDADLDLDLAGLLEDDAEAPTLMATANRAADASTIEQASPHAGWNDAEAPTVETPSVDADAPTMETPWARAADDPDAVTMESPWDLPTVETPTIESPHAHTAMLRSVGDETSEMPALDPVAISGEPTAEIDLDDLGLSVEDLSGLPDDIGSLGDTREQPELAADDDLLSATGVTRIVDAADEDEDSFENMATAFLGDRHARTAGGVGVIEHRQTGTGGTSLLRALTPTVPQVAEGGDLDLDLDDLAGAFSSGDTVEQPHAGETDSEIFAADDTSPADLDLDVGVETAAAEADVLDPHTMTEIGTKLDLARAYIDMGDPEGARSILDEVLDEGDSSQRREAQSLIDAMVS